MKLKSRLKRKYYILISIFISLFLYVIFLTIYSKKFNIKVLSYIKSEITNDVYANILKSNNFLISYNTNDIFKIYQNKDGEILYVDYDLNKTYNLLNEYVNYLKKNILTSKVKKMPFFISSDNILLTSLGPKIYIKYDFLNNLVASVKTKITNFGVNNALIEIYFEIDVTYFITTPVKNEKNNEKFNILVSSKVINGRVPEFYKENIFSSNGFRY